jgi:3-oxoacyl-[acyl-carrier-protein] synthase II
MTALQVLGLGTALPPGTARSYSGTPSDTAAWFDVATALPGRGYKRLPLACQYLLAAARGAVDGCGGALAAVPEDRRGVVVGTNNAALALHEEQDRTIIGASSDEISPITAPYFAMSLFAARLATEHAARGFALTVNTPRTAGLDALQVGARSLAAGRADLLLVGAAEETLPDAEPGAGLSDTGAVVMTCGLASAEPNPAALGDCLVHNAFLPPGRDPADLLDTAWHAVGADALPGGPERVQAVLDDSPTGRAVAEWLSARATGADRVEVAAAGAGCLGPLRHLAAALTATDRSDLTVVTASAEGNVAFARLTINPFYRCCTGVDDDH